MAAPAYTDSVYQLLVTCFFLFSIIVGYIAGTQPKGEWRYFSWHPFCMICGLVGCAGIAAVTKKLGGYTNTKNHGIIANIGTILACTGLYIIYTNKNYNGSDHFTTYHGKFGLVVVICCVGLGMVGGLFLHPDFGIDKTNTTIRYAHKTGARITLALAWMCCVSGMYTLTQNTTILAMLIVPLVALFPFTLL